MTSRRRRRKPPALVPRRGPATNLRPAGAHESLKRFNRKKAKSALRQELAEGGFCRARSAAWNADGDREPDDCRRGAVAKNARVHRSRLQRS